MRSRLKVLLLLLELPRWKWSRSVSYCSQLGFAEALQYWGAETLTVTTPWFPRLKEICSGRKFDQLWIDIVHSWLGPNVLDNTHILEQLESLAPVRIGILPESLNYNDEEIAIVPDFAHRRERVTRRCQYLTHVVTVDELDADHLNNSLGLHSEWWPPAVPIQSISSTSSFDPMAKACFRGSIYGKRSTYFEQADYQSTLCQLPSPERHSLAPIRYNFWSTLASSVTNWFPGRLDPIHAIYQKSLLEIRQVCFRKWLQAMKGYSCVVNLPHMVKTYAGRVVEGMAAGMPVVSWEIPDRPRNRSLFIEGEEILLYDGNQPETLIHQVERLKKDQSLAEQLTRNARKKLLEYHTLETRVKNALDW